jgi:hypothetical protein
MGHIKMGERKKKTEWCEGNPNALSCVKATGSEDEFQK